MSRPFDDALPGTVIVQWDDGSALVKGDGTDTEYRRMVALLMRTGSSEDEARDIARILQQEGSAVVESANKTLPDQPPPLPPSALEMARDIVELTEKGEEE